MINKCKLCKSNEANKKNSHIFPFFLTNDAFTYNSSKKRGDEFIFRFSSYKAPISYIGKGFSHSDKEKLYELVDNIQVSNSDLSSEDYIFCEACENKFSLIETYFATNVRDTLEKNLIFNKPDHTVDLKNKINKNLVRLFVYSLFWRASISIQFGNFRLPFDKEEKLRYWLNTYLDSTIKATISNCLIGNDLTEFPLTICYHEELDDPTESFIFIHPLSKKPYAIFVNRFSFFLYFNIKETRQPLNNLFGFYKTIKSPNAINYKEEKILYQKVFKIEYHERLKNFVDFYVDFSTNQKLDFFKFLHNRRFNRNASKNMVNSINYKLLERGTNITDEDILKIFFEGLEISDLLHNNKNFK